MLKKHISEIITIFLLVVIVVGYGEFRHYTLLVELKNSENALASTTEEFQIKTKNLDERLSNVIASNDALYNKLNAEQSRNDIVQEQVGKVASTIGTLDKLSKTDPQLLQKYSKVYFLNEHYTPSKLVSISSDYLFAKDKSIQIHTEVWPRLEQLLKAAASGGLKLQVASGYRSFGTQAALKSSYKVTYGAGTANQFSADQGYSEHQLGTAVDFTTPALTGGLDGFDKTPENTWLISNAYRYGFVLSYPKSNTYYQYEPWHWRYVGIDLANKLQREGKYFYGMDQREIDNYLTLIF